MALKARKARETLKAVRPDEAKRDPKQRSIQLRLYHTITQSHNHTHRVQHCQHGGRNHLPHNTSNTQSNNNNSKMKRPFETQTQQSPSTSVVRLYLLSLLSCRSGEVSGAESDADLRAWTASSLHGPATLLPALAAWVHTSAAQTPQRCTGG